MTTMEPGNDDDIFRDLIDTVDFGDAANVEATDYSEWDLRRLLSEFEDAREALAATGEELFPKSEEAIGLSAVYHGLKLEMHRRGLL